MPLNPDYLNLPPSRLAGHPRRSGGLVPINTVGLSLRAVETVILQTLARGRKASLEEAALARLMEADLADPTVTDWADALAERFQVTWSRRPRFGGLLFELIKPERTADAEKSKDAPP